MTLGKQVVAITDLSTSILRVIANSTIGHMLAHGRLEVTIVRAVRIVPE